MRAAQFLAIIGRGSKGSNALENTEDRAGATSEQQDNVINTVNSLDPYGPSWQLVPGNVAAGTVYAQVPTSGTGDLTFTRASTATRTDASGNIVNVASGVPRIDYRNADGSLSSTGRLLLEPQRTNLALFSETFNNDTGWFPTGRPAVTSNAGISPSGYQDADLLTFASGNALRNQSSFTFTNAYTYSIFVKKDVGRYVTIAGLFFTRSLIVGFDLDTKTAQAGGTITDYGNGWLRLSIFQVVTGDPDRNGFFYVYAPNVLGDNSSANGNSLYAWGCQIEDSTYATTYIPTTTAAVTRIGDAALKTGVSSLINSTEGVLYAEIKLDGLSGVSPFLISASDGTNNNRVFLGYSTTVNKVLAAFFVGGVAQYSVVGDVVSSFNFNKIAIQYKQNDFSLWINGIQVSSQLSGSTLSSNVLTRIGLDGGQPSALFYGSLNQAAIFPTRLTNAQLAEITTL
jgi:hypothetical protein